jgi:hypothetical protein
MLVFLVVTIPIVDGLAARLHRCVELRGIAIGRKLGVRFNDGTIHQTPIAEIADLKPPA